MSRILSDILENIKAEIIGNAEVEIKNIQFDSRKVELGDVFVATVGTNVDGHTFIEDVTAKGAAAIVCQELPANTSDAVTYVKVANSQEALGEMASNFFERPSEQMHLVGVTGTNGKTSIATLLYNVFEALGYKVGLFSTIKNIINGKEIEATHTTPDAIQINELINKMVEEGCEYAFMEVSSHSADQKRIAGLQFAGGIFTNLTRDHLDYHETFDAYLKAKKSFFDMLPKEAFALTNADDKNGMVMLQNTKAKKCTYGIKSIADYKGKILESHLDGMLMHIGNNEIWTKLIGKFNASNILAVFGACSELDVPTEDILTQISNLSTVEGRFEYLRSNDGVVAIIDYAHTPDALQNVLETIQQIRTENEQVITVVGAGGNRDKGKRPLMAAKATSMSDKVILTSDNPRDEEPDAIIKDMFEGVPMEKRSKVLCLTDRKEAIKTACMLAQPNDIILVAGKGHEDYQVIKGETIYFSDKAVIAEQFMLNNINLQ